MMRKCLAKGRQPNRKYAQADPSRKSGSYSWNRPQMKMTKPSERVKHPTPGLKASSKVPPHASDAPMILVTRAESRLRVSADPSVDLTGLPVAPTFGKSAPMRARPRGACE